MISRVPGYGRLEYLVLGLSCESHHVTLINIVGLNDDFNWGWEDVYLLNDVSTTMIVKIKVIPLL